MSDLNKLLALNNILPYLNKEKQDELINIFGMSREEIEKRLVGKNKEDEFLLIIVLMNVCKSITAFDEGVSQILKTATSDLLVELKNGFKFMLEIKHTDNEKYSISGGNLGRRIEYAHKFNLKLYFAISIKGYWMLFDEDYLKHKSGKIDVSDMQRSRLDEILGCVSYIFPKDLRIKSVYSKTNSKTTEIKFDPYGYLVSYELYYNNRKLFRVKGKNSPYIGYTMILEALQDRLSMDRQSIEQSGEYTIINESFLQDYNMISEYKFLLATIEHTAYEGDNKYTAHDYLENAKADPDLFRARFEPGHIRGMMQYLADSGVDIKYVKNCNIYELNPTRR